MATSDGALIHARGLTKRFGDFTAVDAIDFDVAPGEAFGFLGPNGAGKTSTMRMIGCVSPKSGGTLRVLGMDPDRRRGQDPGPAGRGAAGRQPRRRAVGPREPAHLRALLRGPASRRGASHGRAAGVRPAHRPRRQPSRAAVRGHEAPTDHRPGAHRRADPRPPRRAHDRASIPRLATCSGSASTSSNGKARRSS